ncbi:MAG: hypothetical protein AAGF36_15105 [Pseudomonadota bacterium]
MPLTLSAIKSLVLVCAIALGCIATVQKAPADDKAKLPAQQTTVGS